MTVFNLMEKQQNNKIMFLPSDFFIEIFVTNPKDNIHSKIQS